MVGDSYGPVCRRSELICLKLLLIGWSFIRHRMSGQNVDVQLYCAAGQLTDGGSLSVQHK